MADNVTLDPGSGGVTLAADDIGGVHHQRVKLQHGADGSATDVSTASPLPVGGAAAEDAAAAGNPALVGGRYDATPRTLDDGDVGAVALDAAGQPLVNLSTQLDVANDEVAVGASAGSAGGITPYRLVSAATINATVLKASAGRLYYIYAPNANAAVRWCKLYDKATTPDPSAGDLPKLSVVLPPNAITVHSLAFAHGIAFENGIGFVLVTGSGDTDETAVGAGDVLLHLGYK